MDADHEAYCNGCSRPFHLALRVDVAQTDCGEVWINDEHQTLQFTCNACLGRTPPVPNAHRYRLLSRAELRQRRSRRRRS